MVNKEPMSSETATTSEKIVTRPDKTADNENTETSNSGHYWSFPLLPLPPREYHYYRQNTQYGTVPTEDKMGTLHNAIIDTQQQPVPSSSSGRTSSDKDGSTDHRVTASQSAVRFVPRTTNLENRKRRMEEDAEHLLTDVTRNNETLIGPKLPEPHKLDMKDESLNTTVSLIRNTMKKVACNLMFSLKFRIKLILHSDLDAF